MGLILEFHDCATRRRVLPRPLGVGWSGRSAARCESVQRHHAPPQPLLVRKALQIRWHTAGDWGAAPCPIGKTRGRREIGSQSPVSPGPCQASFHRTSCVGRLAAHSSRRRPGSQSIPIGGRIQFAQIVWPARLLRVAERPAAGPGGLATSARADCQPHSEHRPRPIAKADIRRAQAFAVCAASRFIDSGGTLTSGTTAPTRMPPGTVPASSPGNSGMRRVTRPSFWGVCKRAAAARPADGYGRPPRLTTGSPCFGCGTNTETRHGPNYSVIGACQTFR
jgi:hypothetical protein